jgi:sulfate transport system substrate-binding protein
MSLRPKLLALGVLGVVALSACGSSSSASSSGGAGTVDLVAYSTPKPAYDQLIRAFNATPAGKGVGFTSSYGASGDQARSVISGLDAGYVAFSLQTDMDKLVKAGKVATSWNSGPTKGFVTDSVVVFVVRKGNPKHIESWADLVKPDVKVITPNPFVRLRPVEHPRRLRAGHRERWHQRPGRGLPAQALRQHRHPAGQRAGGHPGLHQRHWRRAALL